MHAIKEVGLNEPIFKNKNISVNNYSKILFLLCSSLLFCFANAQVVTIKVSFTSAPTFATSSFADLKYNKQAVFNLDIDDQPANVMSVLAYLQGGTALEDGKNYAGKFFTDGCGNKKPYTAAVAMTAHSNYNDGDLTLVPHLLSASQLTKLVASDFMLENHGFYHDKNLYYLTNNFNEVKNIVENANFIYAKTGFVPRVWVTPSNNTGYNAYVEQQGYLAATSQGVTDGYTSHPVNMWTDHLADISKLDAAFNVFLRDFTDDWANTTITNQLKSFVTGLKNKSSSAVHKLYRLGTHSYNSGNWSGFKSFIDHLDSVSNDAIWVTSLQELLEYLEVKRLVAKTETLNGNVLTINLDLSKVPASNRFRDMSLLINGSAGISAVTVSGADNFSYNESGLINILKKKTVADPPYNRPIAIAGPDQEIILPDSTVQLNGSVFDTMRVASFAWSKISGPQAATISSPSSASTTVTGLTQGSYVFRLTVTDNQGATAFDEVTVVVNPQPASGGSTRIEAENWTAMSGVLTTATTDEGGGLLVGWIDNGDWMDYRLTTPATGSYTLNFRVATIYSGAQFVVKNSSGQVLATVKVPTTGGFQSWQTVSATVNLPSGVQTLRLQSSAAPGWNINWWEVAGGSSVVNQPPTVSAGVDQTITLPTSSVTLSGSGSDPDGSIAAYSWTKVSGGAATIASPSSASTSVSGLTQGSYVFRLTVTDNAGATAFDEVTVVVNAAANQTPSVSAGTAQTITLPVSSVTLNGTATDADGFIISYNWSKISGPFAIITSPSLASTSITGLVQGSYVFQLSVADNSGAIASDKVTIIVNAPLNQPPVANAGADQTITLPVNTVQLNGSGSDSDGLIASYGWSKVSGPAEGTISNPGSAATAVTSLVQGIYIFKLTVSDDKGATATDDIVITVNAGPPPNQLPVANAGTDKTLTLPVSSVTLNGSGNDPDGSIVSYAWSKVSGPSGGTIASPSSASTTVTSLVQGTYTFRLTVKDNAGATASDDVVVTVNAAANQSPTANAGTDKTITLPANSVTLSGSGSDPDGSIASYSWTKISGGTATITSPASPSTTVTGLVQGSYVFRLTVKDNQGASASDDVVVVVNAALPGVSLRIEAEAFTAASSVIKQATQDLGGGQQLSALDDGDWMQYWVEVPYTGTYTVSFRVASTKGGSKFQLLNAAGLVLGTANLPNTGNLQNWQTVSIQATLTAGGQTLKIFVSKSSGNPVFNWWQLSGTSASSSTQTSANPATAIELQDFSAPISDSAFLAYPNPFQDHFTMQVQNSYIGQVKVQLFNLNGVLQKQFVFNKTNVSVQLVLSVNDLPRGEYVLMILTDKWEKKGKVIKL